MIEGVGGLPPLPDGLVERPLLLDQLDGLLERPVTLVTAPAGFGKTTLVAHWCRSRCAVGFVWLSVDVIGFEPEVLVAAVVRSATGSDLPGASDEWLTDDRQRLEPQTIDLIAGLLDGTPQSVLVVDGVDATGRAGVVAGMATAFARAQDCGAHLVAIGRCGPPVDQLALQRGGRAARINASDLELGPTEVAEVVAAYAGRPIGDTLAVELTRRLEGWVAGAALVGMSHSTHKGAPTVEGLMNAALDDLAVYVDAEVLRAVDSSARHFITLTACLDVVPSTLCDLMFERNDSERLLTDMRTAGLPLTRLASPVHPSDRAAWFRCLRPVRDVLDRRLVRYDRATRERCLRIAAAWFSEQQRLAEAAECWVQIGDWNQAANLIIDHFQQILHADDDVGWLVDLVQRFPPSVMRERLNLALIGAWVLRIDGRIEGAYEMLAIYEPHMTQLGRTVAGVIRAGAVSWVDDVDGARRFADAAIAACDELGEHAYEQVSSSMPVHTQPSTATFRALAQGHALIACSYGALWHEAEQHLTDVTLDIVVNLQQVWTMNLHGERATFLALSGRAAEALAEARQALERAAESQLLGHRAAADAHYALGEASRLVLDDDGAFEAFDRAQRLAEVNQRRNLLAAIAASRANLFVDRGDADTALSSLRHSAASHHRAPTTIAGLLAAAEARALAHVGAHGRAIGVLDEARPTAATATARVAVALAIGDVAGARQVTADWPDEPTVNAAVRHALAEAAIAECTGEPSRAGLATHAALAAASHHRLLQPFVEYGPLMARLLSRADRHGAGTAEQEFARHVSAVIRDGSVAAVAPRFTAKEAVVLAYLSDDLQLRAIAKEMHVSINTVKSHVKAIYRKLGVNSRADAVAAWRGSHQPPPPA